MVTAIPYRCRWPTKISKNKTSTPSGSVPIRQCTLMASHIPSFFRLIRACADDVIWSRSDRAARTNLESPFHAVTPRQRWIMISRIIWSESCTKIVVRLFFCVSYSCRWPTLQISGGKNGETVKRRSDKGVRLPIKVKYAMLHKNATRTTRRGREVARSEQSHWPPPCSPPSPYS